MLLKIYSEDAFRLVEPNDDVLTKYRSITAAGGIVVNDRSEILMIFRRSKWDLPKGKAEAGETMEACAEREIGEETGLTNLELQKFLVTTYHTYTEKGKEYLKDTHWFLFRAAGNQELHPQAEEDISLIEWIKVEDLPKYTSNTYLLINDVLESFL